MCAFTFTVFVSLFLLLPSMPDRVLALGGSTAAAGLFLGLLTYASALSAPLTGAMADRLGHRRTLIGCSLAIALCTLAYLWSRTYWLPLVLAAAHGVFWSGLLSASAAYLTGVVPESRRAEGIGWWGMSTIVAIAVAPALGFELHARSWTALCATVLALNLLMAAVALRLPAEQTPRAAGEASWVEWRVLGLSFSLFLYSFGYGAITSFVALYTDALGVTPRSLFFSAFAVVVLLTRPGAGRLGDRVGHRAVLLPCLVLIAVGLGLLSAARDRSGLLLSAAVFGAGFGTAYPVYAAHVVRHVDPARRGAVFGSILAAFDVGIGTGSIATGRLAASWGYPAAFAVAALLASLAVPYFLLAERRLLAPVTPR